MYVCMYVCMYACKFCQIQRRILAVSETRYADELEHGSFDISLKKILSEPFKLTQLRFPATYRPRDVT